MKDCTLCASNDSPGFYTGCIVKDGHAPEWRCDGNGNLTPRFCDCFGDSGMHASTHRSGGKTCCDLCGWPVPPGSITV